MFFNPQKFIKSFRYALEGIRLAINSDQNVRFHILAGCLAISLAFLLQISRIEFLMILLAIFFVVMAEMVNTAIEEMTNLIKKEHSREAQIAKDIAAGSVFIAALFSVVVALLVFIPNILKFL